MAPNILLKFYNLKKKLKLSRYWLKLYKSQITNFTLSGIIFLILIFASKRKFSLLCHSKSQIK